jgi:alpha-beta hydrolase superfamily lysophospholipase
MPLVQLQPDVLGPDYRMETITLPPDEEGPVVATLVSLMPKEPTGRAVLHVHGFADYFFHTEYAQWWADRGYAFYALDLRKYGRSLRKHQTPHYVADLGEYYAELDLSWWRITERDRHDEVIVSGHSTGGLTVTLWAHDRRHEALSGMVLNSPWFDMAGSTLMRTVGTQVLHQVARHRPKRLIPREVSGLYARSLHRDHEGEWDFDLDWKPLKSWPVYAGWLAAIRRAHRELHRGIDVGCPVLVLTSGRTSHPRTMGEDVHGHDIVLDVEQIRRWAPSVGRHVTVVSLEGARHDVVLSREPVRKRVYEEIDRFLSAYVDVDASGSA